MQGDIHIYIFQVVDSRPFYPDIFWFIMVGFHDGTPYLFVLSCSPIAAWKFLKDQYKHCDRHYHCPRQIRKLMCQKIFGQPCIVIDHFPQTSAGVCTKISLTTLSFPATILSTLPHSRHNNPGEKVQYSTKRNRACKQQYQFQKITKPINKKMIVSDAKSSPNIGKYLIFSPRSNLFQFFITSPNNSAFFHHHKKLTDTRCRSAQFLHKISTFKINIISFTVFMKRNPLCSNQLKTNTVK